MIEESEFLVSSRRIWSRKWHAALVFLPGKFDGQRSLAGLWGSQSWTQLNTHTHTHIIPIISTRKEEIDVLDEKHHQIE